ncbi:MAG: XrtA/PEP-CTERM system TPR-repeat protein PrsT [Telluria sp.]
MRNSRNKKLVGATVASAVLLLGSLGGCGKTETSESLVAEAKQFIQKGDTKAAVIQLKNALTANPSDVEARLTLGNLYNEMGDALSAEKEYRKAAELGAPAERSAHGLGMALLVQQQFQKALDETESIAKDPQAMVLRGDAYLGLGKVDEAKAAYEAALAAKPGFASAQIGLARQALAQKDVDGAMQLAEQAVTGSPKDANAWMFRGDMLRAQGKQAEALAAYDQALKVKPDHRSAHIEKAYVEIGMRKFDAARADIEAARKVAPNSLMVVYTEALLNFTEGKHEAAREQLQKILGAMPNHLPSVLLSGAVENALGSLTQAEQHLRKYLAAVPDHQYARKLLVSTLLKLGQPAQAKEALEPMMAQAAKDPQLLVLAGELAMQGREFGKATDYFEKAAQMAPQAAAVRTSLAMSKLAQGDDARAVAELEESTRLDGKSVKAGTLLVLTEMRMKRFDKALAAVNALEKQQPKDPMVQNLKGGVYMAKGDAVNARAGFEKALAMQPTYFPAAANLAQMAMKEKNPALAKKILVAFLEKDKKNIEAMGGLAELATAAGKPAEATQWLEKALAENPDAVAPAVMLGSHYLRTGDKQKALLLARKYQVANPTRPELLDLLGQAQLASGDKEGAMESYSKLVGLAPKSAAAHFRMAGMQMMMKTPDAAAASLKKSLELDPGYLDAQLAQAEMDARAGRFDQAHATARQIQQKQPKNPVGYVLEGSLHDAQGKAAPAARAYEKAVVLNPSTPAVVKMHSAMTRAGEGKEADARLLKVEQVRPGDLGLSMYIAETQLKAKQYKAASTRLEAVVRQMPKNAAALNNLAWAYQQQQDPRALKTAEQALALAGDSPAVLDTIGALLVEQGNTGRGLGYLKKAVELAPKDADIRYHLAQGLAKSGDKAGARKQLDVVLADKNFSQADEAKTLHKSL